MDLQRHDPQGLQRYHTGNVSNPVKTQNTPWSSPPERIVPPLCELPCPQPTSRRLLPASPSPRCDQVRVCVFIRFNSMAPTATIGPEQNWIASYLDVILILQITPQNSLLHFSQSLSFVMSLLVDFIAEWKGMLKRHVIIVHTSILNITIDISSCYTSILWYFVASFWCICLQYACHLKDRNAPYPIIQEHPSCGKLEWKCFSKFF